MASGAAGVPCGATSVVVPMYNEAENVEPLLERIHLALGPYPWPWEVVLVDDGSSDGTPMANVLLTVLRRLGVDLDHIGDSTGELNL